MTTVRATTFAGLDPWAKNGVNPVPGSPSNGTTYLTTLTSALMDAAAQYGTTANSGVINQLLQTITEYCIELESGGILSWLGGTTYVAGALVKGANNDIYQSIAGGNVGHDPTSTTGYWRTFGAVSIITTGTVGTPGQAGYSILPGGLIFQWGTVSTNESGASVTFPVPFPTACLNLQATYYQNGSASAGEDTTAYVIDKTSGTVSVHTGEMAPVQWFAVGF